MIYSFGINSAKNEKSFNEPKLIINILFRWMRLNVR